MRAAARYRAAMLRLEVKWLLTATFIYETSFVTSDGRAPEMMKRELQQAVAYRDILIIRAEQAICLTTTEATKYLEKQGMLQHADTPIRRCGTRIS